MSTHRCVELDWCVYVCVCVCVWVWILPIHFVRVWVALANIAHYVDLLLCFIGTLCWWRRLTTVLSDIDVCVCVCVRVCVCVPVCAWCQHYLCVFEWRSPIPVTTLTWYGVATISRLIKIIGLFCKRALWKKRYSAKETYNFGEPTNHSHEYRD